MSVATRPRYTIQEYVRLEEYANLKHEYLDGQIWAMAGGTPEHARMALALGSTLIAQLRGRPCAVYSSDARIRVLATGLETYPDVSVVCGREERDQGDPLALTNPIVVVEITSDSSEAYDRVDKLQHYERIAALREIIIVSHREPRVDVFRRGEDGIWTESEQACAGGRARLASIGCTIDVDEIYRDPFTAPA
jgi:Uma2 family endonuclease